MSHDGISAVGTAVAADAPPASDSDKDTPATPTTATASFRRFRFEVCFVCGMFKFSQASTPVALNIRTLCIDTLQDRLRTLIGIAYSGFTHAQGAAGNVNDRS
jgi:hypothetical protein